MEIEFDFRDDIENFQESRLHSVGVSSFSKLKRNHESEDVRGRGSAEPDIKKDSSGCRSADAGIKAEEGGSSGAAEPGGRRIKMSKEEQVAMCDKIINLGEVHAAHSVAWVQ